MTDRQDHLAWCKKRALEYMDSGDLTSAVGSMMSDMSKHPETISAAKNMIQIAAFEMIKGDSHSVRKFIEGFQ